MNKPLDTDSPRLVRDENGLALVARGMALQGDFRDLLPRIRPGRLSKEMLVKAAKIKGAEGPLTALDATAGLGEDAFLLAAAGFTVELYERDETIGALLEDALARAAEDPELAPIVGRMHLRQEDSITALAAGATADVIHLDPMFPAKQKAALTSKKLQMFQQLEAPCTDEEALLQAALDAHPRKIVIKRPLKGPSLAGRKPSYSLEGKTIRYDVIVLPQ